MICTVARAPSRRVTFGIIVGNRGFFPGHLARIGRDEILAALAEEGYEAAILDTEATNDGAVESRDEAKKCAELFKSRRDDIDGIIVTLPNFGDERGLADAIRSRSHRNARSGSNHLAVALRIGRLMPILS